MAQIFNSIRYFTTGRISSKVEEALESGGAKKETYFTDYTTHLIVGESPDEDVVNEAHDLYERPALRAVWATLSATAGKLLPLAAFNYAPTQVFRGVRVCCSRLGQADVRLVWSLVTYHGGAFQRRLDASCTHLVIGEPEGAMYARCLEPGGPLPVTPDWVTSSAAKGALGEVAAFHPRLLVPPAPATPPPPPDPALAAITGFGEEEDRRPSGEQEKQQQLARLKQNLPWNQPEKPAAAPSSGPAAAGPRPAGTPPVGPRPPGTLPQSVVAGVRQMGPRMVAAGQLQRLPVQLQQQMLQRQQSVPQPSTGMPQQLLLRQQSEPTVLQPGQRLVQVGGQQVVLPHGQPLTPEIRQQILNNQQNLVQPKTKTALANLLNNRLSSGPMSGSSTPETPGTPVMTTPPQSAQQATGLGEAPRPQLQGGPPLNSSPGGEGAVSKLSAMQLGAVVAGGPTAPAGYRLGISPQKTGQPTATRVQYFGHDPNLNLPPDLCLLGCVFLVVDYQHSSPVDELKSWCKVISQFGGEVEQTYSPLITHILCLQLKNAIVQSAMRDGKRCVTAYWLSDVILQHRVTPPWQAIHLPVPYSESDKPGKNLIICVSGFEDKERSRVKHMIEECGAKYTGYMTRHNTTLICRKPEGAKYAKSREWKIPAVNMHWLSELLLGNQSVAQLTGHQKYQQFSLEEPFRIDYNLVPHLLAAWKAPIIVTREIWSRFKENPPPRNKRKMQEIEADRSLKKTTLSPCLSEPAPPPADAENGPRVLFSACSAGGPLLADTVRRLGGAVSEAPTMATHLVMHRLQRTVKFLSALPSCSLIVSEQWVEESGRAGRFLPEKPFMLADEAFEKRFNFSLAATLAKSDRRSLFKGMSFHVTPGVIPGKRMLTEIIQCSGGTVEDRMRPLKALREARLQNHFIITCETDLHLVDDIYHKAGLPIYSAEFVLSAVLRQMIDYTRSCYVRPQQ